MVTYLKIGKDAKLIGNTNWVDGTALELEGICRGMVCIDKSAIIRGEQPWYAYTGILQRSNGELLEFRGNGGLLECTVTKASSEMGMPVTIQGYFLRSASTLIANGLRLGGIKTSKYEE